MADWTALIPVVAASSVGNVGFLVWGTYIKDPPLFVSWREHKGSVDRGDTAISTAAKLVDQNAQLLALLKEK